MLRASTISLLLLCATAAQLVAQPMSFDQYLCRITPPAGWQRADVGNPPVGVSLLAVQSPSGKSRLALVVLPVQRTFTLDDPTFVESLRESIMGKLHGVSCTFGKLAGVKSLQCKGSSPQDPAMKMTMTAAVANGYGYVLTAVGPELEIATPEAAGFSTVSPSSAPPPSISRRNRRSRPPPCHGNRQPAWNSLPEIFSAAASGGCAGVHYLLRLRPERETETTAGLRWRDGRTREGASPCC
ncbi:MAG: hypothetical protein UZ07_CHB004003232 [Chlorobi bacterium OLB7]|nr:MAG: hypothetical protein UZ07_CHB004003232 [Chlorobi bacterium OLB7]